MNVDQVVRVVATKGPMLPIQLVKELGTNTMLAGALLSQLVEQKRVFISHVKVGGSPLYYTKGQETKLQEYAKYLNEKDRKTYDLLKENKILQDGEQSPLVRVSLRNIKDFAIPLEVTLGNEKLIFWKWYLLNEDESRDMIRTHLKVDEKMRESKKEEDMKKEEDSSQEKKKETEGSLSNYVKQEEKEDKKEEEKAEKPEKSESRKEQEQESPNKEAQKEEEPKVEIVEETKTNDNFANEIISFLKEKNISVRNIDIKRKNSEVDLHLLIPSAVGHIEYYCKAKNKKRVNDSDISSAYVQGQLKKLPAMFITTGDLTKKAKEVLSKEIKISILKM